MGLKERQSVHREEPDAIHNSYAAGTLQLQDFDQPPACRKASHEKNSGKRPTSFLTMLWATFIVLAAIPCGLWLGSGCEILTKSGRVVEVEVINELFGETMKEMRLIPGPIFGYYIGLDSVAAVCSAFLIIVGVLTLVRRIRRRVRGIEE